MLTTVLFFLSYGAYAQTAPQAEAAQPPKQGIFGRVVNSRSHEVVRRAVIKVFTAKDQWDALTDGDGRFQFPSLAPGDYRLAAHRDGYSDSNYIVERSDFTDQKELPIELRPQGLILGRVADGSGKALQSARIEGLGARSKGGPTEVLNSAETNDLGEYRLSGLEPGTYQLRATYREGRASEFDMTPLAIATSYYGGSAPASQIAVQSGAITAGIDFVLTAVRPVTVRGKLRTDTEALSERTTLWIMGKAGEGGHNGQGLDDGTFEIRDVAPGTYTISAETFSKSDPLFGITTLEVRDADVDSINITLKPIPRIAGELQMVEGSFPDLGNAGCIYFSRTDRITAMGMEIAHPDKDHKFTIPLIPGEYRLSFDAAINKAGVRHVTLDDKPVTDWKFQIGESPELKRFVVVLGSQAPQ